MSAAASTTDVAPLIAAYSPNIEWGRQIVEITIMQWDYKAIQRVEIGGNCRGLDVLTAAVRQLYEQLPPKEGSPTIVLANPAGELLHCTDEEDLGEDWLRTMVVAVRIVDWIPPSLNEVRRLNGAPPIPGGDRTRRPL